MKTKIASTLAIALSILFSGCSDAKNTLTSSETEDGWKLLFDGKTTDGWRGYMDHVLESAWSVQDGILTLKGGNEVYANIITDAEFDDFELVWDWKLEEGSNSGLMFHVAEGPKQPYLTGPEYQMIDNAGFRNSKGEPVPSNEYTASHYAIEDAYVDATNPIGEWNTSRVRVVGNSVQYWLNGQKTAEYELQSELWKEQVAKVKFGKWPLFGTTGKGHIALQDHGHAAYFKNIKIKEL